MHLLMFYGSSRALLVLIDLILALVMAVSHIGVAYSFRPGALTSTLCVWGPLKQRHYSSGHRL